MIGCVWNDKILSLLANILFKISSQLKLCGDKIVEEDMLEETFTTFHDSNVLLQQQFWEWRFTNYFELILYLLVAKQNDKLLLKDDQSKLIGFVPFPQANPTSSNDYKHGFGHGLVVKEDIILNTMVVIIRKILPATRSGMILKQNHEKRGKIYKANKLMRMNDIDVTLKGIGYILIICDHQALLSWILSLNNIIILAKKN